MPIYKQDASGKFVPFAPTPFPDLERALESWIEDNPHLLLEGEQLAIVARQPRTTFGKYLDLLAIDITGAAVIVELKRGETPRDVVAQALEYAAWVDALSQDQLDEMARDYAERRGVDANDLQSLYNLTFGEDMDAEGDDGEESARVTFNNRQRIVVVAEQISEEVEQTLRYLRTRLGADVYGIAFSVHRADAETIVSTTTVVGRERTKLASPRSVVSAESVEDTLARVKNQFLRNAVTEVENWAAAVDGLAITRVGRASDRKITFGGTRWAYYYFAANWIFVHLFGVSEEEVGLLRSKLSAPESVKARGRGRQCSFRVAGDGDLVTLKEILLRRVELQRK